MKKNKQIPKYKDIKKMADFWETHSLADYWDQTEPANFEISSDIQRSYLVPVDCNLLQRIQDIAHVRGVSTESLINLLLEQRLHEIC